MVGISPQEYARRKAEEAKVKRCKDCRQAEPPEDFPFGEEEPQL